MNKFLLILMTSISLSQANIIDLLNAKNICKASVITALVGAIAYFNAKNKLNDLQSKQWHRVNRENDLNVIIAKSFESPYREQAGLGKNDTFKLDTEVLADIFKNNKVSEDLQMQQAELTTEKEYYCVDKKSAKRQKNIGKCILLLGLLSSAISGYHLYKC